MKIVKENIGMLGGKSQSELSSLKKDPGIQFEIAVYKAAQNVLDSVGLKINEKMNGVNFIENIEKFGANNYINGLIQSQSNVDLEILYFELESDHKKHIIKLWGDVLDERYGGLVRDIELGNIAIYKNPKIKYLI